PSMRSTLTLAPAARPMIFERQVSGNVSAMARRSVLFMRAPLQESASPRACGATPSVPKGVSVKHYAFRSPRPRLFSALHRIEELVVGLGVLHLVEHEFHRGHLVHRVQQLAQDPDLLEH